MIANTFSTARHTALQLFYVLVYRFSVADADYEYDDLFVFLFTDNSVTSYSQSVVIFLCDDQFIYVIFQNSGVFSEDEQRFFDNYLKGEINFL